MVRIIYGDERRLKQILVNLLNNAVKFTPIGGQIGLRVQGSTTDDLVRFMIWDTGVGIATEDMEKLFEPFVQIDSRLSRQYEGTGLGLALVYRMTKLHGGSVTVESEVAKGSYFTVSLPWSEQDQILLTTTKRWVTEPIHLLSKMLDSDALPSRDDQWLTATTNGARRKVFIVEDNETNIHTFTDYLQAHGYEVDGARNGIDALIRLREIQGRVTLAWQRLTGGRP